MFLRKTERVAEYKNLGWKLLGNLVSSEKQFKYDQNGKIYLYFWWIRFIYMP